MTRASLSTLAFVVCALGPGCSLPRDAIGTGRGLDAGTGTDAGGLAVDAGPGIDVGAPPDTGPRPDAGPLPDTGGCHGVSDCPADEVTLGACVYAATCDTMGAQDETRTHYACIAGTCTPQTTTTPTPCTRETDGTACGAASCGPCSASACDATGMQMCTGPMCQGGACVSTMTMTACTTPNDMCGGPSMWSICYYDIGAGHCVQTRSWGACVLGACIPRTGHSESRDCSC